MLRHDRQGNGGQALGDGRGLHAGRLRRGAGAVLRQKGGPGRRYQQECERLSRAPEGAALLPARPEGARALFRDVPGLTFSPLPATSLREAGGGEKKATSEIIPCGVSAGQHPIRLFNERPQTSSSAEPKSKRRAMMRFMMLMIPGGYETAAPGTMPPAEAVSAMMNYSEALDNAGVLY